MEQLKTCSKCKALLPLSSFHKHKGYQFGVRSECKRCTLEMTRQYRKNNPEKRRSWEREYRKTYSERGKTLARLRYHEDIEKSRAKLRERYEADPQRHCAYSKKAYRSNREHYLEYSKNQTEQLTDSYVAYALIGDADIPRSSIPQELIELKRAQLLLARKLKELKK